MINSNGKMEDNPDVFLIDFGCASKYECATTKKHITESEEVMYFRGNLIFSSIRQMDFYKTSRRDDLIAVFYLMFTLLNDDDFFLDGKQPYDEDDQIEIKMSQIMKYKEITPPTSMINQLKYTLPEHLHVNLLKFSQQIEHLHLSKKPSYSELQKPLISCLQFL